MPVARELQENAKVLVWISDRVTATERTTYGSDRRTTSYAGGMGNGFSGTVNIPLQIKTLIR